MSFICCLLNHDFVLENGNLKQLDVCVRACVCARVYACGRAGGRACVHMLSYVFINLLEPFLSSRFPEQFCYLHVTLMLCDFKANFLSRTIQCYLISCMLVQGPQDGWIYGQEFMMVFCVSFLPHSRQDYDKQTFAGDRWFISSQALDVIIHFLLFLCSSLKTGDDNYYC